MEKKLYRIWYLVYLLEDEEDFAECYAESEEAARKWFKSISAFCSCHITSIEEADSPLL